MLDGVLEVVADEETRISRIVSRDGRSREQALSIMKTQSRFSNPTFTIANNGQDVEKNVLDIIKNIQSRYKTDIKAVYKLITA